jgi:transcriptional regulator with XRE-family HTH domain
MLGQALREARHPKGWNIEQLSKSSGVPGGLIREIENQSPSYVPSENNTILLGEALRIPLGSCSGTGNGCSSGGVPEEATLQGVRN